jgi:DNA-binding transcriptional MerR regulator
MQQSGQMKSREPHATERLPIRLLSERTGVGASTLRAWERRYGMLTPERTPKGHRLYSEEDVRRVEHILTLLEEGHSLPAIAEELIQVPDTSALTQDRRELAGVWSEYLSGTLQALHDFSTERLEAIYNEASSLYPVDMVTERLIEPVLVELGSRWQQREAGIAEEHFYASWVRNRLGARFHHAVGQARGARILCAGLPGSHHEIGLLLFSLSALTRGYRVLYLGVDLPLDQVPLAVSRSAARGVVLSSRGEIDEAMQFELARLSGSMDVPLMLGGPCSDRPLATFEGARGIRLGSRIAVALRVLGSHVPLFGAGEANGRKRGGDR